MPDYKSSLMTKCELVGNDKGNLGKQTSAGKNFPGSAYRENGIRGSSQFNVIFKINFLFPYFNDDGICPCHDLYL